MPSQLCNKAGLRAGWLRDDVSDCDRRGVASELALTSRSADPAPGREFPGSQPSGTAAARNCAGASGGITVAGALQPMSRPFTVSLTSMLPRVALEYGHT